MALFYFNEGSYSVFLEIGVIISSSSADKLSMTVKGLEMNTEVEDFILLVSTRVGASYLSVKLGLMPRYFSNSAILAIILFFS